MVDQNSDVEKASPWNATELRAEPASDSDSGTALAPSAISTSMTGWLTVSLVLVSGDPHLVERLRSVFAALGLGITVTTDRVLDAVGRIQPGQRGMLLLDSHLPEVANGLLLATLAEEGAHRRNAIALIADQVTDAWIARLREGVIDDIVPRSAETSEWLTHLSSMERGHTLYCELEQLRESSLLDVEHDQVTGMFNRSTTLSILFRETDRVQRLSGTLTVILFGVDNFSQWQEQLGEAGCNELLRQLARRAEPTLRSYDLLGRMGDCEFLVALPGCSTVDAMMLAERLRSDVFGTPLHLPLGLEAGTEVWCTASFAIASSRGRSPLVVLREAEQTLERCRQAGPDGMRCHNEIDGEEEPVDVKASDDQWLFPELGTKRIM